jgi:Abnormal spindle-like microcephaly-assoc'd, ASPM-SPD-2-Hydin
MERHHSILTVGPAVTHRRRFRCCIVLLVSGLASASCVLANEPMVVLSASELKFPAQPQGTTSAPAKVLLTNNGGAELVISSITIGGVNETEFTETHNCPSSPATLAASAHCEILVVFKPKTAGDLSATLNISDNASGSPRSVMLTGQSGPPVPAVALSPVTLAFGNQPVGTASKTLMVVLSNTGSVTLNINTAINITGPAAAEFHLQKINAGCPEGSGQLAPNASCSIGVVFAPLSTGPKSAQVIIVDDAAGSPQTVALSGAGSGT